MSLEIYKKTVLEKYPEALGVFYEEDGETLWAVITNQKIPRYLSEDEDNELTAWANAYLKVLREPKEKSDAKLTEFCERLKELCEEYNVCLYADYGEKIIIEDNENSNFYVEWG